MADTTLRKRASDISLSKHCKHDQQSIAESLGMSRVAAVSRINKQFNPTGCVTYGKKNAEEKGLSPPEIMHVNQCEEHQNKTVIV